ncbi:hypothetical protein [Rhizobium leguminosarum]|uniref:hypothetical protein n=1 Tax=Rhizobium leguminosarum TaxID=384 RepID=UPI0013DC5289|nr:hypothetical protein [Rhizobium leguminosarum]NEK38215.1 hypothetical protein [Rhizobium leguminosarum]
MTTSERVVEILIKEGGYRELPRPFKIGTLAFDFTSALVGTNKSNDLVVVIELKGDTVDDVVIRKVLALTRALDVLQSKRSVTAVLTSGQAAADTLHAISRVCRVLPVGSPTGEHADDLVHDWLAVLLPLKMPQSVEAQIDWEADMRSIISSEELLPLVDDTLRAANAGKDAVEAVLRHEIEIVVDGALKEEEE